MAKFNHNAGVMARYVCKHCCSESSEQSQCPIIKSVWQDRGLCLRALGLLPLGHVLSRKDVKIELPHDLDHVGKMFLLMIHKILLPRREHRSISCFTDEKMELQLLSDQITPPL